MGLEQVEVEYILRMHDSYWDTQRERMQNFTSAYMNEMLSKNNYHYTDMITVETSDGYALIESMVASCYSKRPALEVGDDPQGDGDPEVMKAVVNQFLYDKNLVVERALRFALLYPYSFFKLGISDRPSILDSVDMRAIHPWEVIVDFDADDYEDSRYVGHKYFLSYKQAVEKFPKASFYPVLKGDFLDPNRDPENESISFALGYVEIVELYDLMEDEVVFYSENVSSEKRIVDRIKGIPFRKADGDPQPPLVPVYLSYAPDSPLKGFSALARVYDQLWETNNMRTVWANSIRRNARMYVAKDGSMDQEALDIMQEGLDQSVITVRVPDNQDVRTVVAPLSQTFMSPDFTTYKAEIRSDLDRGSVMAPFTRGTATNASATEIAALTQYASSEIGRLSRFFHESIEQLGRVYQSVVQNIIQTADSDLREVLLIDGEPVVIREKHLVGSFKYAFADQASTPISGAIKKQQLQSMIPLLMDLGVAPDKIKKHVVDVFDLPDEFLEVEPAPAAPGAAGAGQVDDASIIVEGNGPAPVSVGGGDVAAAIRSGKLPE